MRFDPMPLMDDPRVVGSPLAWSSKSSGTPSLTLRPSLRLRGVGRGPVLASIVSWLNKASLMPLDGAITFCAMDK